MEWKIDKESRIPTLTGCWQQNFIKYVEHGKFAVPDNVPAVIDGASCALDTLIWEYLNSSIHLAPYLEEKFRRIYVGDAYKFYRQRYWRLGWRWPFHRLIYSDKIILNNALDVEKGSSDIFSALKYFNSTTEYMMQLRTALGELRDDIE